MRHRMLLSLGALVLATTALAAAAPARLDPRGGVLRISSTADLDSVDPALAGYDTSFWITFATCAKLYNNPDRSSSQGAIVIPEVATGFPKVSDGGRTQTIQLRRTYHFHTGERITAANFVAAFNRDAKLKRAGLPSYAADAGYLHEIVGADAVIAGKASSISGVRALGSYSVRIRTTQPLRDLAARLTVPAFCPVATDAPLREMDTPPGSGPYYVASRIPNRELVLERNRFYAGPRPANVDRIVWSIGLSQAACLEAVEQDTLDYCLGAVRGYGPAAEKELARKYGINRRDGRYFVNPTTQTFYFAFNHDRPAFRGVRQIPLKQAINWALDRAALVRAAGFGEPTDQILPPAMTREARLYPTGAENEQNLTRARRLLAKARVRPTSLTLYAPNIGFFPAWAQVFQRSLKRIGIDVIAKYFSFDEVSRRAGIRGEPFDVVVLAWSADYADAATFFGPLLDGDKLQRTGNSNLAHFDRPKFNLAIAHIDKLRGSARRRAWASLDIDMMRADPPWAPAMNGAQRDFVSASFGCYVFQPVIGHLDLDVACKK